VGDGNPLVGYRGIVTVEGLRDKAEAFCKQSKNVWCYLLYIAYCIRIAFEKLVSTEGAWQVATAFVKYAAGPIPH